MRGKAMRLLILFLLCLQLSAVTVVRNVKSGGAYAYTSAGLQSAIDSCAALESSDPCIVEVEARSSAGSCLATTAGIVLTPQTSTKPKLIYIRSSRLGDLASNVRITPGDERLACITSSGGIGVIAALPEITGNPASRSSSHYILQGLDLQMINEGASYGGAVSIGLHTDGATKARQHWQQPNTIVVDRCWLHGVPYSSWSVNASTTHALVNGIRVDGRNITVKNSVINELQMDGVQHGHGETHGVFASNGTGALYVINNHIEGAIGSILGGEAPWISGLIHTGSWWYGNEYAQDPASFHWLDWNAPGLDTTLPCLTGSYYETKPSGEKYLCVGGAWQATNDTRVRRNWHKNGWECKSCRAAFVDGLIVHDFMVDASSQSQLGHAILLNNVDVGIGAPHSRFEYATIQNVRARRVGQGIIISGSGATGYVPPNHITIRNVLMDGIAHPTVQYGGIDAPGGTQLAIDQPMQTTRIEKITSLTYGARGQAVRFGDQSKGLVLRDLLMTWGVVGFKLNFAGYQEGCPSVTTTASIDGFDWRNWALINEGNSGQWNFLYSGCPGPKQVLANFAAVRFVKVDNGGNNGDYRLCSGAGVPSAQCTGASPLLTAGSDGGPLGADTQQIEWATTGIESGTPDFAWTEFKIRRADKNQIRYTSYNDQVCSGTIKNSAAAVVHTWSDEGGPNRDRITAPPSLSPGIYDVRVTCDGGRWREGTLKYF